MATKLPGEHILLYDEIDGNFPNHFPDPTIDENMKDPFWPHQKPLAALFPYMRGLIVLLNLKPLDFIHLVVDLVTRRHNYDFKQTSQIIFELFYDYIKKVGKNHKDEFLGIVSHDLRTPLSIIISSCEFILNTRIKVADIHKEFIERSLKNAKHANSMVKDILDATRLGAVGGLDVGYVEIGHYLSDLAENLQILADQSGIMIVCPSKEKATTPFPYSIIN